MYNITTSIKFKEEQKMKYNGKEIEVTCTPQNGTSKITITHPNNNDYKVPFTNINKAAKWLVSKYGGTKKEALTALNNFLQEEAFIALNNLLQKSNNKKGQEDRCIEISMKDFFNMSMEEFDTYVKNEFLKKGIDINDLSLPPEEVKERYKDEIKALEEAEAKALEEKRNIDRNIDRLVNHFKQEYKNKYNKDYNPTDREIEHLRIVVVDRYNYTIEQWEGIISTYINSYDENWKSDKYPEPRISDTNDAYYNYALVREWVIERVYSLFKEKDRY
jgi:hypothetical protein